MNRPTKDTAAGQKYLDLQREAKRTGRPTDELIQLYALEGFLDRLTRSPFAQNFVLKGGVLLAVLGARRPTRDIDFSAQALDNETGVMLRVAKEIAAIELDDGLEFDADHISAESIREEDEYSGVRITVAGALSRARIRFHVDINFGDPIWPQPQTVHVPRLLKGELVIRGYPLEMVLAEKIVTTIARGTANTRWRDFLDIYVLIQRHSIQADTLRKSLEVVAEYRKVELTLLKAALAGFANLAQARWGAWLKKQQIVSVPQEFQAVLDATTSFADPIIGGSVHGQNWNSADGQWA